LLGKTKDRLQSKRYKRCLLTDRWHQLTISQIDDTS
jgi:hypothetical protein